MIYVSSFDHDWLFVLDNYSVLLLWRLLWVGVGFGISLAGIALACLAEPGIHSGNIVVALGVVVVVFVRVRVMVLVLLFKSFDEYISQGN